MNATYTTTEQPGWYANSHSVVYVTKAQRPYLMSGPDLTDEPQVMWAFDAAENDCEPIDASELDALLVEQAAEIETRGDQ
jgi:hypothetical protein